MSVYVFLCVFYGELNELDAVLLSVSQRPVDDDIKQIHKQLEKHPDIPLDKPEQ